MKFIRSGDVDEFVQKNGDMVGYVIRQFGFSEHEVEDVAQDFYLKLYGAKLIEKWNSEISQFNTYVRALLTKFIYKKFRERDKNKEINLASLGDNKDVIELIMNMGINGSKERQEQYSIEHLDEWWDNHLDVAERLNKFESIVYRLVGNRIIVVTPFLVMN